MWSDGSMWARLKRWRYFILGSVVVLLVVYLVLNPINRFGMFSSFGLTTYSAISYPISDIQVRADGASRLVDKTHVLKLEEIEFLLQDKPDILIIGIGYEEMVSVGKEIKDLDITRTRAPHRRNCPIGIWFSASSESPAPGGSPRSRPTGSWTSPT